MVRFSFSGLKKYMLLCSAVVNFNTLVFSLSVFLGHHFRFDPHGTTTFLIN
jgi:hypothetical protein